MVPLPSVIQAFDHFFLKKFTTPAGSQILFRFDKQGFVISDQDFIDPSHPEWGYIAGRAMEMFSGLVNRIPAVDAVNIFFAPIGGEIDDTYYNRLLSPSIPYIPPGTDADKQQAIIQAFGKVKDEAIKIWESTTSESLTGLRLQYKPSLPRPENWYDTSRNELWASHAFEAIDIAFAPTVLVGSDPIHYEYTSDQTKPLPAHHIAVLFDYCPVNVLHRPWYSDVLINDKSWCIPTVPKGQLTTIGRAGNLSLIPIGFAMIRNLTINGNWTANDEAKAIQATGLGPFQVTWDPVNKKLYHQGPQIIGWALQRMPDLPPNSHPDSTLKAPQQVSPADGSVFNNYPRTTTLKWTSVSNATSYTVEVDMYDTGTNEWVSDTDMKPLKIVDNIQTTSFTFEFVAAQPGRWRVWAVDAAGREGEKSPWREFVYTT